MPLNVLAEPRGLTPGALAARLARARACLRVEFLLASRRLEPPTSRCRPVLTALATGDRRRQRALRAGEHVLGCEVCAAVADDVARRGRPVIVAVPFLALAGVARSLTRRARAHPAMSTGVLAAGAAAGVALGLGLHGTTPTVHRETVHQETAVSSPTSSPTLPARSSATAALVGNGRPLLPLPPGGRLVPRSGQVVVGHRVLVQELVDERGFWVGGERQRVLVVLELGLHVAPLQEGELVSFRGILRPLPPGLVTQLGLGGQPEATQLEREGQYVSVTTLMPG